MWEEGCRRRGIEGGVYGEGVGGGVFGEGCRRRGVWEGV